MKQWIFAGILALSLVFCFGLGSNATAEGWPTALLVSGEEGNAVGLIDFNQNHFTAAEAEELADLLQAGTDTLLEFLASKAPGFSAEASIFGPSELDGMGLGDAAVTDDFILKNLNELNVEIYIKAVATKVTPPQGSGAQGNNIRVDLYFYSEKLGSELTYGGSVEVLEDHIERLKDLLIYF